MFTGCAYLLLSLAAVTAWQLDPSCAAGSCSVTARTGYFLGVSWWLWGALFYSAAGILCLTLGKNRAVGVILAAGAVFHAGLIAWGYITAGQFCPVCCKFAVLGTLLTVCYWLTPGHLFSSAKKSKLLLSAIFSVWIVLVSAGLTVFLPGHAGKTATPPAGQMLAGAYVHNSQAADVFQKETSQESFQEKPAPGLQATAEDGSPVSLDLSKKPAFIFAVWCPGCNEGLKKIAGLPAEKRPYIVVTYLRDGDMEKVPAKLAENGLAGEEYFLAQKPPEGITRVPILVWWDSETSKYKEARL